MPFKTTIAKCREEAKKEHWIAAGADAAHSSENVRKGCVAAVKALTNAPETAEWRRGKKVRHHPGIEPGTAIATFSVMKDEETFGYKGHAAIYARQDSTGLHVYDQYIDKSFGLRKIFFKCKGYVSNDGDAYFVIEAEQDSLTTDPLICKKPPPPNSIEEGNGI